MTATLATVSSTIGHACLSTGKSSRYPTKDAYVYSDSDKPGTAWCAATDGRMLAVVNGCSLSAAGSRLIPASLLKAAPKRSEANGPVVTIYESGTCARSAIGKVDSPVDATAKFPPFADVIPTLTDDVLDPEKECYGTIGLNAELLHSLAKALQGSDGGCEVHLVVRFDKFADKPMTTRRAITVIPAKDGAPGAVGVLMPVVGMSDIENARKRCASAISAARRIIK